VASGAGALDLPSSAALTAERVSAQEAYDIPLGPFDGERVPLGRIDGSVKRQAWRFGGSGLTPLQVLRPIRDQLLESGYEVVLDCSGAACGGFDFRFSIDVLSAPAVFVNLRSFHYFTLVQGSPETPDSAVTLLASMAADATYVQIVEINKDGGFQEVATNAPEIPVTTAPTNTAPTPAPQASGGPEDLLATGSYILDGVAFETGATALAQGSDDVLQRLAAFLRDNPSLRIALVGHTDSVGSLNGNIAISKRRAQAVRQRLIDGFDVPAAQIDAEGMGYLSPRASNLTEDGRTLNRRVEAIVVSTE